MKKWRLKKGFVYTGIALSVIFIIALLALHFVKRDLQRHSSKLKSIIAGKAKKVVTEATDSLYKINYSKLDFSLDAGYALVQDLTIVPDTNVYRKLIEEGKGPIGLFKFSAKKLTLANFRFHRDKDSGTFHVGSLALVNPSLEIVGHRPSSKQNAKEDERSRMMDIFRFLFKELDFDRMNLVQVDAFNMRHLTFKYTNENGKRSRTTTMRNLDIEFRNCVLGAFKSNWSGTNDHTGLRIGSFRLTTSDRLYDVVFKAIRLTPQEQTLTIDSVLLIPRISVANFPKVLAQARNTRYQLRFSKIALKKIDFEHLRKTGQFHIGSVYLGDAWFDAYTDYNWPLYPPPPRRDAYPHELFQHLAFDVLADRMIIGNANTYYRMRGEKSKEIAVYALRHIAGTIDHITNNDAAKRKDPYTRTSMKCLLMGTGPLDMNFIYHLDDPRGTYEVKAALGKMDGTGFNPLTKPLSLMEVKSADLEKMQVTMKVDEYEAKGNIDFWYQNVKIRMLKRDDGEQQLKRMPLISFLANAALPDDNPRKHGAFRKGPINAIRDPRESYFGFLWRAALDGLTSVVMGTDQRKYRPRNIITKIAKPFAGPKDGQEHRSSSTDRRRQKNTKK